MDKITFNNRIEDAKEYYARRRFGDFTYFNGACPALRRANIQPDKHHENTLFTEIFKPKGNKDTLWLGPYDNTRMDALDLFREYVLSEGLYESL